MLPHVNTLGEGLQALSCKMGCAGISKATEGAQKHLVNKEERNHLKMASLGIEVENSHSVMMT
jgi:hypothetical protein